MMRAAMLVLAFAACGRDFVWRGVPPGASCAYTERVDERHCVVDGRVFLCVTNWDTRIVECAPMPAVLR